MVCCPGRSGAEASYINGQVPRLSNQTPELELMNMYSPFLPILSKFSPSLCWGRQNWGFPPVSLLSCLIIKPILCKITDASVTGVSGAQGALNPLAWFSYTHIYLIAGNANFDLLVKVISAKFLHRHMSVFSPVTDTSLGNIFGNILLYLKLSPTHFTIHGCLVCSNYCYAILMTIFYFLCSTLHL